jgi:hypothetical protein
MTDTSISHDYLTPEEVSELTRQPVKSMAVARCLRRDHPPYLKVGRKILYRRADVLAWLDAHVVSPAARKNDATLESSAQHDHPTPARCTND